MRHGGMLPKDHAGHDTLPHDSHQDTMFRGRPAGLGCTPTTTHITAPLAWLLVWWTGSMRSASGSTCIHCLSRRVVGLGHLHLLPMDLVKMSKTRRQLSYGNKGRWSKEIFRVEAMRNTSPLTYVVADAAGEPTKGTFYGREIQKDILTWMPSWTTAGMGTPHSTWLSGLFQHFQLLGKWPGLDQRWFCHTPAAMLWTAASGCSVFIAPWDGKSCMHLWQLHGLHTAQ